MKKSWELDSKMHPGIINNGHGGKITIKGAAVRLINDLQIGVRGRLRVRV